MSTGTRIGRYTIRDLIGYGSTGVVYAADQDNPQRKVALKLLRLSAASPELRRRFEHESQLLARLRHPGIAEVFEAGSGGTSDAAQPYFAMELIEGVPITRHARDRELGLRARLDLIIRVCAAVEHAHQNGIIHRDLKPGNILVDDAGNPKIVDFGVARATESDVAGATLHTGAGQIIGTLSYMSPEQVTGNPLDLDTRADVYAVGVVAYELITGRLPYELDVRNIADAIVTIRERTPIRPGAVNRTLRGDLETILMRALEKDKSRRYASVADFAADLRRYLRNEPILARPQSAAYLVRKLIVRHKRVSAALALLFVAVVGFGIWMSVLYGRTERLLIASQIETDKADRVRQFLQEIISQTPPRTGHDLTMKEALDAASRKIDTELHDYPEVEEAVRTAVGDAYRGLHRTDLAVPHYRRAVELSEQIFGREHEHTAQCLRRLGIALRGERELEEAEEVLREAAAIQRRVLGPDHLDVSKSLNSLGHLYCNSRNYDQAREVLVEAVAIARLHPEAAKTLAAHLTSLSQATRDPDAKKALLLESLEIQSRIGETMELIPTLGGLRELEFRRGNLEEAESWAHRSVALVRKTRGTTHVVYGSSLCKLARVLRAAGNLSEAELCLREALITLSSEPDGREHRIAAALRMLSEIRAEQGDLEEAELLSKEAGTLSSSGDKRMDRSSEIDSRD